MRNFDLSRPSSQGYYSTPAPAPKKRRRKLKFLLIVLILAGFGFGASNILSKTNQIFANKKNVFVRVGQLLIGSDKELIGEDEGQVNILLLGMGGPGHDGPFLTDTMMVASIDVETNDVVLTSIPRDFLVQLPKRGFGKINAAYAYGIDEDDSNAAGLATIAAAEKVTGLAIPYYAAVNFQGFVDAIDHVDGLTITIDRTFTDTTYPDSRYGYLPPVTFTKGEEHMDGERSLVFARSRKGNNNEGSDFARSERQKKIMIALKDKILDLGITNLGTLNNLLSDFTENFRTNLEPHELKRLAELGKKINADNVYSFSLEPQGSLICNGFVEEFTGKPSPTPAPAPTPDPAPVEESEGEDQAESPEAVPAEPEVTRIYVVQPCEGKTLSDIHEFVASAPLIAKLKKEDAAIEIQNSTGKSYALDHWRDLADAGINIKFTTFKGKTAYEKTILYDNSAGQKTRTAEYLKSDYNFEHSDIPYSATTADFVIILGKDAL